jgi:hypothetical protein
MLRRGVAHERRHGARDAAEDDVLRPATLQVAGVDDDVEEIADEREHRRQEVRGRCQQRERRRREREPELERARRREPAGRHRARRRPRPHQLVDVAVEHVVERSGAAARESEAEERRRHERH